MPNDTLQLELHFGLRLRRRRRLLGLTQKDLAAAIGLRFQQIQKYECGANRISAARLWQLSEALEIPIDYFYDNAPSLKPKHQIGAAGQATTSYAGARASHAKEVVESEETEELLRAYYSLGEAPRRRLLDMAKAAAGVNR